MIETVDIFTLPHNSQRYDTIGDWRLDGKHLDVSVSRLGDWRMQFACGIHEAIEAALCAHDGVDQDKITRFDELYEARRTFVVEDPPFPGKGALLDRSKELEQDFGCDCVPTADSEPGEDPHAPYRKQHAFADGIERLLANELGVVWSEYADKVEGLVYRPQDTT